MSSVVLTGSSGTIGTAIGERLLSKGIDVVGVDREQNPWSDRLDAKTKIVDLRNPESFDELPDDPGIILHFAANSRVHDSVDHPAYAKENIDVTYNLLEYARRVDDARLIFASSREVYGEAGAEPQTESSIQPESSNNPYAASKVSGEALVHAYRACYDIESVVLRLSNVYGKYDASDRVVPLFIAQATRNERLHVYGPEKILDFVHIDDCVDGILSTVEQFSRVEGNTFNIATGRGTSILELSELIVDITDSTSEIVVDANRDGEVERFIADIGHARSQLDFEPDYSIEEGIQYAVSWYQKRDKLLDKILS